MANAGNLADEMVFQTCGSHVESLIQMLDYDSMLAIRWFEITWYQITYVTCYFPAISMEWCG